MRKKHLFYNWTVEWAHNYNCPSRGNSPINQAALQSVTATEELPAIFDETSLSVYLTHAGIEETKYIERHGAVTREFRLNLKVFSTRTLSLHLDNKKYRKTYL